MKRMIVLALALLTVLTAAAGVCETLKVGMECNYAPYNWTQSEASDEAVAIAAGGYADGYDVRIAKIIAEELGMELEIVKTEWDGLAPALLSGKIDCIIAGMSPTAERKVTIDFTDPYYVTELCIVVRKDSKYANAKSISELKDAQIGAMVGTISYTLAVKTLKKDIKTFNDNAALAQAVDSNQVDAMVVAVPIASNIVNSGQVKNGKVLGAIPGTEDPEGMAIVLPKNSPVTSKLTKAMNELLKDGTVKKLQDKWLSKYTTGVPMLKK